MSESLAGLRFVAAGGPFTPDGTSPAGRRLLGWTTGGHWALSRRAAAAPG
jgi:hypothetical protein